MIDHSELRPASVGDGQRSRARRRILILHPSDEPYGADRVLLALVDGLLDANWDVSLILSDDAPEGWLSEQLSHRPVSCRRGPLAPARRRYLTAPHVVAYALTLWRARRYIRSTAQAIEPCVILVNTSALPVGALIGRPARARLVWHVHEIVRSPALLAALLRRAPLTADRVIVVSDAVRRHLDPDRTNKKIATITNGIAVEPPAEPDQRLARFSGPVVLFVGRLNRWKGYELFVQAAKATSQDADGATFVIAGDPPPGEGWRAEDLDRRVVQAGLSERVQVLGRTSHTEPLYAAADVVVVPSIWPDPFPTVVLEAMRSGTAIIASNCGGIPEMIEDGISGVLVPPGEIRPLVHALRSVLSNTVLRARLGANARERFVREFTVQRFQSAAVSALEGVCR